MYDSKGIYGILKLYSIYKWKKAKVYNIDSDLHGNPLNNDKYTIRLLENNTIYTFKIHDLLNIIKDNLSNIYIAEYLVFFRAKNDKKSIHKYYF